MKGACIAPCYGLTGRRKKVWNLHDNGSSPLKMEVSWGKNTHKWRNVHGNVWLPNGKLTKLCHYTILDVDHNQAKIHIWGTLYMSTSYALYIMQPFMGAICFSSRTGDNAAKLQNQLISSYKTEHDSLEWWDESGCIWKPNLLPRFFFCC